MARLAFVDLLRTMVLLWVASDLIVPDTLPLEILLLCVVPLSENFRALEGQEIDIAGRDDALREEIATLLATQGGEWEIRVQLARDLAANPIEDASVAWPEEDNPYVRISVQ